MRENFSNRAQHASAEDGEEAADGGNATAAEEAAQVGIGTP